MDTSKEYIKMAEKASEIQSLRGEKLWKNDDFYNNIWLPRQDQLQEMLTKKTVYLLDDFYWFVAIFKDNNRVNWWKETLKEGNIEEINKCSMEQLWLAFVMEEKYNKIWDGEDWVLANQQ